MKIITDGAAGDGRTAPWAGARRFPLSAEYANYPEESGELHSIGALPPPRPPD